MYHILVVRLDIWTQRINVRTHQPEGDESHHHSHSSPAVYGRRHHWDFTKL